MSTSFNVYVGPYFKTNKVNATRTQRTPPRCSAHPGHMQDAASRGALLTAKFCSTCGAPLTKEAVVEVTELRYVSPFEVDDDSQFIDEMFGVSDDDSLQGIWLPNHGGHGARYSSRGSGDNLELTPEWMQDEIKRFVARYTPFVQHMQRQYPGLEAIPAYGVITYYI